MPRVLSHRLSWNDSVGLGIAPASGAVGRALAAHSGRMESIHGLVRLGTSGFGARARRTAAGASALPGNSTAWIRLGNPGDLPVRASVGGG